MRIGPTLIFQSRGVRSSNLNRPSLELATSSGFFSFILEGLVKFWLRCLRYEEPLVASLHLGMAALKKPRCGLVFQKGICLT